ncbi:MAG TPA: O-antigen ligase family protein [Pyrinomonadaceae bacterium]|nr:O-antigen ligase family protein [Pyrinomonadaceae bacterium]
MSTQVFPTTESLSPLAKLGQQIALTGLGIYVIFAPHSVAASSIGVALAGIGWLLRTIRTGSLDLGRSRFDLIILLSLVWSVASAMFSEEPRISIAKLTALWTVFLFYLTRAVLNRRSTLVLVALLILSGCAGALASVFDLVRGRGVVVESIGFSSPFHRVGIQPGDTIWRVDGRRVYSVRDLDEVLKSIPANKPVAVGIISRGEQVERSGLVVTQPASSGIVGSESNHRFRASGWTRHYQTFAEIIHMIALLALGLALAHLRNHGPNKIFGLAIAAASLLTLGLVLTAMRTVIVAFVLGASVIAWRSLRGGYKVVFTFALFFVIAFGAVVVWQTRDRNSLMLGDPSSSLRLEIARVGLSRILIHPIFGHGMDAMKLHWNEWGFPGNEIVHLHSTPLQLAFDRGLPMLLLWLWLMALFWLTIARAERRAADLSDTNSYGILLGTLGALTGFLVSSLVNYNYGDAEVAMLFWFLMGFALVQMDARSEFKL